MNFIDLTQDFDSPEDIDRTYLRSQPDILDIADELMGVQLFKVRSKIVGKQYYTGNINHNEMVHLVREPKNIYDHSAIRVDNLEHQKVGHLCASVGRNFVESFNTTCKTLSALTDKNIKNKTTGRMVGVELEAIVIKNDRYNADIEVIIVGEEQDRCVLQNYFNKNKIAYQDLRDMNIYHGFPAPRYLSDTSIFGRTGLATELEAERALPSNYRLLTEAERMTALDGIWDSELECLELLKFSPCSYPNFQRCFKTTLFDHQAKGIAWMLEKEKQAIDSAALPPLYEVHIVSNKKMYRHKLTNHSYERQPRNTKGGILADEMGLGKSLMSLGLIIANSQLLCSSINGPGPLSNKNLAVQEEGREVKYLKEISIKNKPKEFGIPAQTDRGTLCGCFKSVHSNDLSRGMSGTKNRTGIPSPTLIICPLSVVSAWQDQIEFHLIQGCLKVFVHHGAQRVRDPAEFSQYDLVITTYDVAAADFNPTEMSSEAKKRKSASPLESVFWHRIILDEGHTIRNKNTIRYKAVASLQSCFRWVLTGTPINNGVQDLRALLEFINCEPFISFPDLFDRFFTRPIKNGENSAIHMLRALMKVTSLRRMKKSVIDCALSPKQESIVTVSLTPKERKAYDLIKDAITSVVQKRNVQEILRNYSSVLALITRLRQCCLDISLVPRQSFVKLLSSLKSSGVEASLTPAEQAALLAKLQEAFEFSGSKSAEFAGTIEERSEEVSSSECAICMENIFEDEATIFKACMHIFCIQCTDKLFLSKTAVPCPMCRTVLKKTDVVDVKKLRNSELDKVKAVDMVNEGIVSPSFRSSKTVEIIKALARIRSQAPDDKVVIFSSFVSYLHLLKSVLVLDEGLNIACIDGSLSRAQRTNEIQRFNEDESVGVILCSLKACGTGISLTRANHIFLADLWWSPAVDFQAIDRVHRLGQNKVVQVLRFIVANSIDERILALQKEKVELAKLTFEKATENARQQRFRDIQTLLL